MSNNKTWNGEIKRANDDGRVYIYADQIPTMIDLHVGDYIKFRERKSIGVSTEQTTWDYGKIIEEYKNYFVVGKKVPNGDFVRQCINKVDVVIGRLIIKKINPYEEILNSILEES